MNAPLDFNAINTSAMARLPDLLFRWFPAGKVDGHEFKVGNLTGSPGKSLSINIKTGQWADFASDEKGGDLISLYAAIHQIQQGEAARAIAEEMGTIPPDSLNQTNARKKKPKWTPITTVPDDAPKPDFRHQRHGPPSKLFTYRNEKKQILGYVCRFDKPGVKKEIIPFSYCQSDTGLRAWRWKALDTPRPLYGLDELAEKPNATVIIVEGEKAADAGRQLLPNMAVITWPGGSKAFHRADWEILKNRKKVVLVPDADEPGRAAMDGATDDYGVWKPGIAQLIEKIVDKVHVIHLPDDFSKGWDLADALQEKWSQEKTIEFLRSSAHPPTSKPVDNPAPEPPIPTEDTSQDNSESSTTMSSPGTLPFRALGYNKGSFYFLTTRGQQVLDMTGRSLRDKGSLFQLAPLQYWELTYPSDRGFSGKAVDQAANTLVQACYQAGVYNQERLRGRGAWWDNDRVVLHQGDHLVVDGQPVGLTELKSNFLYEKSQRIGDDIANTLSNREANQFRELCDMLDWEGNAGNGRLLAGFCVIAPICGALEWRPHLWITSAAGGGKSWIMRKIVQPCMGDIALMVQSNTTESGLRQTLGMDARPVIFDEAESETQKSSANIENVLGLMRQASSETGGAIIKGSATGHAVSFNIRSCFVFASIGVNITQHADASRVTVLSLNNNTNPEQRRKFRQKISPTATNLLTKEYCERLRCRAIKYIDIIRKNAETFAESVADYLGNQRIGDQIGALLAGAYILGSTRIITPEEADSFLEEKGLEIKVDEPVERDEKKLIRFLTERQTQVRQGRETFDRNISELIAIASGKLDATEGITASTAKDVLLRHGFNVSGTNVAISNSHSAIKRMLATTPWANGWGRIIKRIDGAESSFGNVRFKHLTSRAVLIPLKEAINIYESVE